MIPTYQPDLNYLRQTIQSVLAQDPGPDAMEIVVVDDASGVDPGLCSTSGAEDRVSWIRQEKHVGIGDNWNTCVRRARGAWVHILHQDDLVYGGFYERLRAGIEAAPAVGAAFCRDFVTDAEGRRTQSQRFISGTAGVLEDWIEHVFVALHLRASAIVVRREVYEAIGGFSLDLQYALDWDMWKRIAARYPLWYEPAELASCRRHDGCASGAFVRCGANIAEIRRSIDLSERLLDPSIAVDVSRRARMRYTTYAVKSAYQSLKQRDVASSLAQIREARKLSSTSAVAAAIRQLVGDVRRGAA
jgi:glycosyltransferase involved in cell wall biosynthesis